MIFLAEAATDFAYGWIGWIVVGLAACAAAINQVDDFLDRRKTKPGQPANEELELSLANLNQTVEALAQTVRDHIKENHDDIEGIHRKVGGVERGARADLEKAIASGNESRERLHKRINELMTAIARMEGKLDK